MAKSFTHLDSSGSARMVDVSAKRDGNRIAMAEGYVYMSEETLSAIESGSVRKGGVLSVAQLAGIMAGKRTSELIPLCHPLGLDSLDVVLTADKKRRAIRIEARASVHGKTGVEMEALTAVSITALTVYDMCKSYERGMRIGDIRLLFKSGGKSGDYKADDYEAGGDEIGGDE